MPSESRKAAVVRHEKSDAGNAKVKCCVVYTPGILSQRNQIRDVQSRALPIADLEGVCECEWMW